jgi:DNA-binding transcriptional MerR regulator
MDQVTTLMEEGLSSTKRYDDDKILTKTMINNYTKNNLLPPPDKKKYSKEHVLVLIFIYYFKNILSIKDIETLLKPITEKYFHTDENLSMTDIYEEICSVQKSRIDSLQEELKTSFARSEGSFSKVHDDDKEQLQLFSLLCDLSFDVYVKKQIIEKLLDEVHPQE